MQILWILIGRFTETIPMITHEICLHRGIRKTRMQKCFNIIRFSAFRTTSKERQSIWPIETTMTTQKERDRELTSVLMNSFVTEWFKNDANTERSVFQVTYSTKSFKVCGRLGTWDLKASYGWLDKFLLKCKVYKMWLRAIQGC